MNWKLYYSRVHGQIHLAAQFTSGVLSHFQNAPLKAGFLVLKGQKMRPPAPVTPKLKFREVSQSGFWNISSHPTSVPNFSQIGRPQLLAPGTLSQTMTLKCLKAFQSSVSFYQTWYYCKSDHCLVHKLRRGNLKKITSNTIFTQPYQSRCNCWRPSSKARITWAF